MRISVLGLGLMGSAIADRLLDAGHDVAVWNRTPSATDRFVERGADALAQPVDAWSHGDVAIVMLAHTAAVEAVLSGERGLLSPVGNDRPRIIVEMSTISVSGSAAIARRASEHDVAFVRSPVTGNPGVVAAGNAGLIVSGPRHAYDVVEPALRDVAPNHYYVGPDDQARVVKLGVNLMLAGTAQLLAEALVLAQRNDIEPAMMLEVVAGSAIGSPFVRYKTDALVREDYTSTFTSSALYKDLSLALECGHEANVPLPVTAIVQQLVQACISSGMADIDFMALVPRLRREAGLDERGAGAA